MDDIRFTRQRAHGLAWSAAIAVATLLALLVAL